jgi:hypothetical protein
MGIAYHISTNYFGKTMKREYLYTIRWTQPYATDYMRPYLKHLREEVDRAIEAQLDRNEFTQAKEVIERIKNM